MVDSSFASRVAVLADAQARAGPARPARAPPGAGGGASCARTAPHALNASPAARAARARLCGRTEIACRLRTRTAVRKWHHIKLFKWQYKDHTDVHAAMQPTALTCSSARPRARGRAGPAHCVRRGRAGRQPADQLRRGALLHLQRPLPAARAAAEGGARSPQQEALQAIATTEEQAGVDVFGYVQMTACAQASSCFSCLSPLPGCQQSLRPWVVGHACRAQVGGAAAAGRGGRGRGGRRHRRPGRQAAQVVADAQAPGARGHQGGPGRVAGAQARLCARPALANAEPLVGRHARSACLRLRRRLSWSCAGAGCKGDSAACGPAGHRPSRRARRSGRRAAPSLSLPLPGHWGGPGESGTRAARACGVRGHLACRSLGPGCEACAAPVRRPTPTSARAASPCRPSWTRSPRPRS